MNGLAQAVLVGLIEGAQYGTLAAGLGLIFAVTRRLHFAMAATFVLTVYVAAELLDQGWPWPVAIAGGAVAGTALGVATEVLVYAPIVRRAPTVALLSVFVAALGLVTVTENVLRLTWPDIDSRQIPAGVPLGRLDLLDGVGLTTIDFLVIGVCVGMVLCLHALLRGSGFGRQIRAVQVNDQMATLVGISERRVRIAVFALGSVLIAAVGLLTAVRSSVTPGGGVEPTFLAVVVVFLAGVDSSPLRFVVAGVSVGVAESLASVYVSAAWSPIVVFGILFAYIAMTPYLEARRARRRLRPASGRRSPSEVDDVAMG